MRVLAGDIGGTKTAIAIVDFSPRRVSFERIERYPSGSYPGLEPIVRHFLSSERKRPEAAAFGVAGPVRAGRAKVTKLPWRIDERRLARGIGIRTVRLLNDFGAAALGIPHLARRQLVTLSRERADPVGPIGVLGAGTGLGQAALIRISERYVVVSSEGGHADLGPRNPLEDRFVAFLRQRFGRASRDRVLSGGGLVLLYEFLRAERFAPESRAVDSAMDAGEDGAAVVSRFGLSGKDRLCRKALETFVSIYGSEAGNLALQYRATGGVYVAGGIAPKILPMMRRPEFLRAFRDKAPMDALVSSIPVRVVLDPRLGLIGAAAAAYFTTMETARPSWKTTVRRARS
jgi:glucokinase